MLLKINLIISICKTPILLSNGKPQGQKELQTGSDSEFILKRD